VQLRPNLTAVIFKDIQEMDKVMETFVQDKDFYINTEFDHHMPVIQLVSCLE